LRFIPVLSVLLGLGVLLVGLLLAFAIGAPSAFIERIRGMRGARPVSHQALTTAQRIEEARKRLLSTLERIGGRAAANQGQQRREKLQQQLRWAGIRLSPDAWQSMPIVTGILGLVLGALLTVIQPRLALPILLFCGALGAMAPTIYLTHRLSARREKIANSVLTYIESLGFALQAGADFRQAAAMLAEQFPGPVAEAFVEAVRNEHEMRNEMDAGLMRVQADLNNPDVDALIQMLSAAQHYDADLASNMHDYVHAVRAQRGERIHERVGKVTSRIVLVTAVCGVGPIMGLIVYPMFKSVLGVFGA